MPWKGSLSRVSAEVHRVVWAEDLEEPPLQKTDNKICKRLMIKIKISADSDCSQQIKRCLLLGRKAMINLDSILKSRGITLPTKVHGIKAMIFPIGMYRCESWTIKKAEHQRIDAFKLWCWRRLLRVPWLKGDQTP